MPDNNNGLKISELPNYQGGFLQAVADRAKLPVAIGETSNAKLGVDEISAYISMLIREIEIAETSLSGDVDGEAQNNKILEITKRGDWQSSFNQSPWLASEGGKTRIYSIENRTLAGISGVCYGTMIVNRRGPTNPNELTGEQILFLFYRGSSPVNEIWYRSFHNGVSQSWQRISKEPAPDLSSFTTLPVAVNGATTVFTAATARLLRINIDTTQSGHRYASLDLSGADLGISVPKSERVIVQAYFPGNTYIQANIVVVTYYAINRIFNASAAKTQIAFYGTLLNPPNYPGGWSQEYVFEYIGYKGAEAIWGRLCLF